MKKVRLAQAEMKIREKQLLVEQAANAAEEERLTQKSKQYEDAYVLGQRKNQLMREASRAAKFAARATLRGQDSVFWMTDISGMDESQKAFFVRGRVDAERHIVEWAMETQKEKEEDIEDERVLNVAREAARVKAATAAEKTAE